jgi:Protein kinase domain
VETLAERIARDGPVSELDAIGWAIRLAKRLEALHVLGVAHGSVSPACVIAAGQDRNARAYLADVQHTTTSPQFHSPERIQGGNISAADDAWALAATLYALLTGQSPFPGQSDADIRQKILAASPPPLAVYDVGDDDLQHILDRAFSRELAQRTSGVAALRRSLEEWHPDRGVANLPPLEDEDTTNDDDDGARTMLVRDAGSYLAQVVPAAAAQPAPPLVTTGSPVGAPQAPVNHGPAPGIAKLAPLDDDDDNVRTVMRQLPEDLAAVLARAAPPKPALPQPPRPVPPRPGAAVPAQPAAPQPLPQVNNDDSVDDDIRTVMRTPEQMIQEEESHNAPRTQLVAEGVAWNPTHAAAVAVRDGAPAPAPEPVRNDPAPAPTVALPAFFEPSNPAFAGPVASAGEPALSGALGTQKIPPSAVAAAVNPAAAAPAPFPALSASVPGAFPASPGGLQPVGAAGPPAVLGAVPAPLVATPAAAAPPAGKKGLALAAIVALIIAAGVTYAFLRLKGL